MSKGTPDYKRTRLSGPRFTEMPDAPDSYEGEAGKLPVVIAGENSLDFYSVSAGPGLVVDVDHSTKTLLIRLVTLGAGIGAGPSVGSVSLAGAAPSIAVA